MKFAWKIFFISYLIIIISFGTGGFILINSVFSTSLNSRIQTVCDNNRYITVSLYAIDSNAEAMGYDVNYYDYMIKNFSEQMSGGNSDTKVKIGTINDMNKFNDDSFIMQLEENTRSHRIVEHNGKKHIQVISRIKLNISNYYIETLTDINEIYNNRDSYCRTYQIILMCVALSSSMVLVFFSLFITHPLVKLSNASRQIANGNFSKQVDNKSHTKEIYELSNNFNTMAQYIKNYIEELKQSAQSRDDFVANFTHELKTPLTSVIGYADMLRSYELNSNERRQCAESIYKEGKRLEALSVNLLNIIVLKNDDINLQKIKTNLLFAEIGNSVKFLLKKYSTKLDIHFESAEIFAEPSLLKTLLYNLIDNACKASEKNQTIELYGYIENNRYEFKVIDNGQGIAENELKKIVQPFYMVDKSRSRHMGGAGLGLTLCNEIANLHGSKLNIESALKEGTVVSFSVPINEENGGEKNEK